jgi:chromosome segregation ATPase
MAEAFVKAVRAFSSDNAYQIIASLTEEVPLLKGQIESKSKEADGLKAEIANLKIRYEGRLHENLDLYHKERNKLEGEKSGLSGNISTLKATIREKDAAAAKLNQIVMTLQSQLDQSKKVLDKEKETLATANAEITELQQSRKDKDNEIDKLKDDLSNERTQVSKAEGRSRDSQKEVASLRQELRLNTKRLTEIEEYTTKLHEDDATIW